MLTRTIKMIGLGLAIAVVLFQLTSRPILAKPSTASVTIELCATPGTVTMPDSAVVNIWGFSLWQGGGCLPAQLPGPVLEVNQGDVVTVILHNGLSEDVSIAFPGQNLIPDTSGASSGGTASYTFIAYEPGTFLYESGTNYNRQVPMGLYGALIVRPAAAGQAYNNGNSAYDAEAVLVLSEIDPALNANPNSFDMINYAPKYWLINGKAYPNTATLPAASGQRLLLRYANAGLTHHTMSLLGMHQAIIAQDVFELSAPVEVVAETIPAGQTMDAMATIPAGAAVGSKFPLYNRQLHLTNGADFPGGMMTFIEVGSGGPSTSADLLVTKSANAGTVTVGNNITYTLTITNNGPDPANGVVLTDTLPLTGVTFISATSPCGTPVAGVITCNLGTIASGSSVPITIVVTATAPGNIINNAGVTSTTSDPNGANNTASVSTTTVAPIILYLSLSANTPLNGGALSTQANDILSFNGTNFALFFDGSDVGVATFNVDAFYRVDADTILMSFDNSGTIPGIAGTVQDEDIVQFDATSLGPTTAGTFSLFFDGSDVGLGDNNDEDVDAIELLSSNQLVISAVGDNVDVLGGFDENDEDLLLCTDNTSPNFGPATNCTWSVYFDGSDVSLASDGGEDVDGVGIASNGDIYLSSLGGFFTFDNSPPGSGAISGAGEDVFICGSPVTGLNTSCTYSGSVFFDGSAFGIPNNVLDAIDLP